MNIFNFQFDDTAILLLMFYNMIFWYGIYTHFKYFRGENY